jgi:hypothetical protein
MKVGVHTQEDGEGRGLESAMNEVINALTPHPPSPREKSTGGLFIRAIRGSSDNVRMAPLTAPFTLSIHSQGHYSHFTFLSILHRAYQMATRVLSCPGLHPTTFVGPSAPDRHQTKIMEGLSWASVDMAAQDLRREHRSCRPVRL